MFINPYSLKVVHNYKKNMKIFLIASIISFTSLNIFTQDKYLSTISETQELSKEVVSLFTENKISESFEQLSPYWPLPENEINSLEEKTIKYINILEQRYGKSIDALKVKNETISDIASRETYLIRFEYSAIRLIFTFYRNDKGWIINAFKWDDSFSEEFK